MFVVVCCFLRFLLPQIKLAPRPPTSCLRLLKKPKNQEEAQAHSPDTMSTQEENVPPPYTKYGIIGDKDSINELVDGFSEWFEEKHPDRFKQSLDRVDRDIQLNDGGKAFGSFLNQLSGINPRFSEAMDHEGHIQGVTFKLNGNEFDIELNYRED